MDLNRISISKCFNGTVEKYSHYSSETECIMKFTIFIPSENPTENPSGKLPGLLFLSGLTCNEDNFITKSGAIRKASDLKMFLICPDTSPRGIDNDDSWDFGSGAGFYLDATNSNFKQFRMFSYVNHELFSVLKYFPTLDLNRISISGHSMGGHGALISAIKLPNKYRSVSAFAPIVHPTLCPWGIKAFNGYLTNPKDGQLYDSTELIQKYSDKPLHILIDQGTQDSFLNQQLMTNDFIQAASNCEFVNLECNMREGYDHSYFFISTFIDNHLDFHMKHLKDN